MSIILNIFFNVSCKLLLMNLLSLKKNKLHYIDRIYSFGFEEAFRDTPPIKPSGQFKLTLLTETAE